MRKQVQAFIASHPGATSRYSGKERILYIKHTKLFGKGMATLSTLHSRVIARFGYGLPFKLK